MSDFPLWVALPLLVGMAIQTGGGAGAGRDVESGHDYIGRDKIYNADREAWREFIARDLEELREAAAEAKQRMTLTLVLMLFLFIAGAIATGVTIRSIDRNSIRMDRIEDRLERFIAVQR